ncbi:NUDIX domain-containing protein [Streptomyces inhibens]|uniref:NUDIX domain-containing protein n=1 Tax=Streptomyces inhibens TaxID=2293571 RepID=UPI0037A12638
MRARCGSSRCSLCSPCSTPLSAAVVHSACSTPPGRPAADAVRNCRRSTSLLPKRRLTSRYRRTGPHRHYALRRVPGNTVWLPSLFVNVIQPTDDGCVMVARMSPSTAAPGRWQLPGGSVEPPGEGEMLDEGVLRRNAARELLEETGLHAAPEDLSLWGVTRGKNRSIGLVYLAPPRPVAVVRERFAAATAAERAKGCDPELDLFTLVRVPDHLAALDGPHADYLEPVVRRYTQGSLQHDA